MLGGIQLSIWQHGAIPDLSVFLANVSLFVSVDFANFILNCIIMKTTLNSQYQFIRKDFFKIIEKSDISEKIIA